MIAVDSLTTAVINALSSGYCPSNKTLFLMRLFAIVSTICVIGLALAGTARFRVKSATVRLVMYTGAAVLMLFALGGGAVNLFALSGCAGQATPGLIRDWPW